jgi:hypothetical protein
VFTKRQVLLSSRFIVVLIVVLALYAIVGAFSPATELTVPATGEQQQEFLTLVKTNDRVFFDAWATGDLSKLPEVYYNDPEYPSNDRQRDLINDNQAEIDAILALSRNGPIVAKTGELSAQMAEILWRRGSSAAWATAVARATAEGRAPTLSDMPDGQPPVMPVQPSDWVEKQIFIKDAVIRGGDHASFVYALDDADSPLLFHIVATNVDGRWYISKDWTTGHP